MVIEKLSKSRNTTLIGSSFGAGAFILALIPTEVREGCVNAIQNSNNPLVIGSMALAAIIFTSIGPSLKNAKESNNSQETNSGSDPS